MNIDNRFATEAESILETPEPFRHALRERIPREESVQLVAHAPAYFSSGARSPATVLAITATRWFVVSEQEDGSADVAACDFDDTLLIELTTILLFGRLRIDYVADGASRSCAVEFNTVMEKLFRKAAELLLHSIRETPLVPDTNGPHATVLLERFPLKFRNAVLNMLPKGRFLLAAAHWPAVTIGFGRELAPAAALALTERELLLISEEKTLAGFRAGQNDKLGNIVTYFPLIRLAKYQITNHERFSVLELEVHASHGGEGLQVFFPGQNATAVAALMDRAGTAIR